jgi:hypothetical protein
MWNYVEGVRPLVKDEVEEEEGGGGGIRSGAWVKVGQGRSRVEETARG